MWPRLEVTSECSSSRTTYFRSLKKRSASRFASSSATCSGVVSRISGGLSFWRWRLAFGVSPVRFSTVTGRPISLDRLHQVALDIDGKRLQRRDVERVDAGEGGAGRDPAAAGEIGQRRQETGERLAGAGRRDQQRAFAGLGAGEQFQLMGARAPALFRKPAEKGGGKARPRVGVDLVHGVNVVQMRRMRSEPCTIGHIIMDKYYPRLREIDFETW